MLSNSAISNMLILTIRQMNTSTTNMYGAFVFDFACAEVKRQHDGK